MKARKLFLLAIAAICVVSSFRGSGGLTPSEAVQIGGTSLGSIPDIVRQATGSEFPELQKHSLLIYERHRNGNTMRYKSSILTVNPDGSLRKRLGELVDNDSTYLPVNPTTGIVEKMDLAISNKRFGNRRNLMYTTSGLNVEAIAPYGRFGYQTLQSVGTEDSANVTSPNHDYWWQNHRQMWGVASLTIAGLENKDVFVLAHSPKMDTTGDFRLKFFTCDRNETGKVGLDLLSIEGYDAYEGWKAFDYSNGIRGAEIATGDIDGDGLKNEIALTFNANGSVVLYVYKVTKSGNYVKVTQLHRELIHDGFSGSSMGYEQACPNVVVGDFDGDGRDEAAFVGRVFPWNAGHAREFNSMRIGILDYNSGSWSYEADTFSTAPGYSGTDGAHAPCQATRCDFDGDGKDEIAILFFPEQGAGTTYPRLERWYCDRGSITPRRDTSHIKGGRGDTSLLGYTVAHTNSYCMMPEEFSITAGPLTGTVGKGKLAEDVAISHINSSRSSVYVIPTQLDSSKNFAGFGSTKTVFNYIDSSEGRRGAIITADFANEALMLDKPVHTISPHDTSYVTVLQAMPYHIDNVSIDGTLTTEPINYTFSGFAGDDGSGKMSVTYNRSTSNSSETEVKFNMASTTETISLLGDAGPYAQGYLSFKTMQANIAGNFDSRAKAVADTMNTIMDFVTDKIDQTTESASRSSFTVTETKDIETTLWDTIIKYSAQQHIWRYKILNNPLPSWYQMGEKADYSEKNIQGQNTVRSLTFTIYDTPTKTDLTSERDDLYQARHEEGNLFSYPSALDESDFDGVEGYNNQGELIGREWIAWSKARDSSKGVNFEQSKINSVGDSKTEKPSELSKTISAIGSFVNKAADTVKGWFGISSAGEFEAADIANLFGGSDMADSTTHSKTFTKGLSTSEGIHIGFYGRSVVPGEEAGHMIMSMPFMAREGTLKVAHAVQILQDNMSRLWGRNSRYKKYPDPSLVLPKKFFRDGTSLKATTNTASAMQARGIRFYIPAADMYSDSNLVAGLTYEIRVPIYNASFKATGDFEVKLSYATNEFDTANPRSEQSRNSLHEIQTITKSLQGWGQNKDWAKFTWTVPAGDDMASGNYHFFVQIDPGHHLDEVHEERLDDAGNTVDVGGNNEGHFAFQITSKRDVEGKYNAAAAILSGASKPEPSSGVLYSAVFFGEQEDADGTVMAAVETEDRTGLISADVRLNDFETDEDNSTFIALLGLMYEFAGASEDVSLPVKCTVTYNGDTYYPEVYLQGINLKPGVRDKLSEDGNNRLTQDDIASVFSVHKLALVPHTTVTFMLHLTPRAMDWQNGSAFEFYVPELAAVSVLEEIANSIEDETGEDTTGEDTTGNDTTGDDTTNNDNPGGSTEEVNKSSGGCDALAGSAVLVCLAGLAFLRQRKR